MAEVRKSQHELGIKLFGTTITLHNKQVKDKSASNDDQTGEKKPEQIIPCPRCKSMETKFCYFNNYNVNQPRHFCKGCQRYWTAGGALRNVPIGAGRRKAKPPCQSGLVGLPESYLFDDASGMVRKFELDGMVNHEWHAVAEQGGFRQVLTAKRLRNVQVGQPY